MRWLGLLASIFAFTSAAAAAQPQAKIYSAEELFRKYKPAVVKIVIRQQHIQIGTGTGFFVSGDGKFVTNYHVVKSALKSGSFSLDFVLHDGKVLKDFQVADCRDERAIDLCLLKLPVKPKSFFSVSKYRPSPGESVYTIGHPQDLDFSISNGIVSALRTSPTKIAELQMSAAISPGNSGGPIFNSRGVLVGVASKFYKDGQNLNFGIQTSEVSQYLAKHASFVSLAQYQKNYDTKSSIDVKKLVAQQIDPAYAKIENGRALSDSPGFHEVTFDFGADRMTVPVPNIFEGCKKMETRRGAVAFQCAAMGNTAIFSVSRIAAEPDAPLMKLNGRKPVKEKPLPIVEMLQEDGSWDQVTKDLSPENRKLLFSQPSEAKCRKLTNNNLDNAVFTENAAQCRFSIYNDLEPDAYSYSIWTQKGAHIYDFYMWMEDASLSDYFNHVPSLAVLGARFTDRESTRQPAKKRATASIKNEAEPVIKITTLPPSFSYSGSETLKDGTLSYMYERNREPAGENSTIYTVSVLKKAFPATELRARAQQLFSNTINGFGGKISRNDVLTRNLKADEMPGVIQMGHVRRKNQNLAVFHATLLSDDTTYMVFAVCAPHESKATFRDFQKMTESLKRTN